MILVFILGKCTDQFRTTVQDTFRGIRGSCTAMGILSHDKAVSLIKEENLVPDILILTELGVLGISAGHIIPHIYTMTLASRHEPLLPIIVHAMQNPPHGLELERVHTRFVQATEDEIILRRRLEQAWQSRGRIPSALLARSA